MVKGYLPSFLLCDTMASTHTLLLYSAALLWSFSLFVQMRFFTTTGYCIWLWIHYVASNNSRMREKPKPEDLLELWKLLIWWALPPTPYFTMNLCSIDLISELRFSLNTPAAPHHHQHEWSSSCKKKEKKRQAGKALISFLEESILFRLFL